MTRYSWILAGFVYIFIPCFHASHLHAEISGSRTVEQAYPGLSAHVLKSAKMLRLEKGLLLKSEGMEIRESQLKEMVEEADRGLRSQLEKNLFFLLEQEVMKSILVRKAQRSRIAMKSEAEEAQTIQAYLNRVVQDVTVSHGEAKDFYDENEDMVGGMPFEQVKEAIQNLLLQQKKARAVDTHIQDLARTADIKINEEWVREQQALATDNPVDKARLSGKPTMVEFGATGCIPCDMMQPILDKLRKNYSDKMNVVFVHVRKQQILGARFGIRSIPVQVFYDKEGKEVFRHVGFYGEKEVLKQLTKLGVE